MGVKISALPAIVTPMLSDIFPVVQGGVTYKETITQLAALLSGSGGLVTPAEVQESAFNFKAATGVNDAFVVALSPAAAAYTDGLLVTMSSGTLTNTIGNPTLQVNGLAAKEIQTWWGNLLPGDIAPDGTYIFIYNAADNNFQLINPTLSTANTELLQANSYNTAADTGTANAYIVALTPAVTALTNALQVNTVIAHANSGASTLTVNGLTKAIVTSNNVALSGGELVVGQSAFFIYSGTYDAFILINSASASSGGGITSILGDTGTVTPLAGAVTINGGSTGLTTSGASHTLSLAGILSAIHGGTGLSSYTQGDIIYASASNTLSALAKDANATRYLSNTGSSNSPAWAQVNLANGVTGNLPVTNLNSGTSASSSTFWRGDGSWAAPAGSGVTSVTGTIHEILVNGTTGTPQTGALTLTAAQGIDTTSSPTFAQVTVNNVIVSGAGSLSLLANDSTIVVNFNEAWSSDQGLYVAGFQNVGTVLEVGTWNAAAPGSNLSLIHSRGSDPTSFGALSINDVLGKLQFVGDDGTQLVEGAEIRSVVANTVSTGIVPAQLSFYTKDVAGSLNLAATLSDAQALILANPLQPFSGGLGISDVPTNGQIPIGNGTNYTVNVPTAGTGISITPGSGTLTIATSGSVSNSFVTDSGTATPSAGVLTITGSSTGLTTTGSGSTVGMTGVLNLAHGGSNAALTAVAGAITYSTASAMAFSAAGSTGQLLRSAGTSTPTWTTSTYPVTNAANTLLYASSANTMAALAASANGVLISDNSNVPSWLANSGTAGFVLTANSGAPPSWQVASGSGTVNSGTANQIAYYATTGTAVSGLTGANSAMLVTSSSGVPAMTATMTNGQIIIGSTGATPAPGTLTQGTGIAISNGAASVTIAAATSVATTYTADSGTATPSSNSLAVVGGGGLTTTGSGATLTITAGASIPTSFATDAGTATPVGNSVTFAGGTGISTSGSGSTVTITATGGGGSGLTWSTIAGTTQAAAVNHGYVIGSASQTTITLPATAAVGDIVAIMGQGAAGWIIAPNSGQTIKYINGSASTSITSAEQYDCIEVGCVVANTTWNTRSSESTGFAVV